MNIHLYVYVYRSQIVLNVYVSFPIKVTSHDTTLKTANKTAVCVACVLEQLASEGHPVSVQLQAICLLPSQSN